MIKVQVTADGKLSTPLWSPTIRIIVLDSAARKLVARSTHSHVLVSPTDDLHLVIEAKHV